MPKLKESFFAFLLLMIARLLSPDNVMAALETLRFHGFGSQGYLLSSDNNFFGPSEEGSFKYHEVGMGASIRPVADLQFSAQVLSRRAGAGDSGDIRLDYGFMDYRFISKESNDFGIRIGRMQNPMGLYNDTPRDVAFTRPSIFLPQSIYFDRTQNVARSSDGVHLYTEHRMSVGDLFYQLAAIYADVDDQESKRALLPDVTGEVESRLSYASRLMFEREGGKVRLAVSGVLLNIRYESSAFSPNQGTIRFRPLIFSAQYNAEFWTLTSEYALRYFNYEDVGPIEDFSETGESFYLQGTYRLLNKLELLLRYDVLYQNRNDRSGSAYAEKFNKARHSRFAKDWTLGLRWDITRTFMSRIEYHYVDGTAWLPSSDNPPPATPKRYWDLFSVLISFKF